MSAINFESIEFKFGIVYGKCQSIVSDVTLQDYIDYINNEIDHYIKLTPEMLEKLLGLYQEENLYYCLYNGDDEEYEGYIYESKIDIENTKAYKFENQQVKVIYIDEWLINIEEVCYSSLLVNGSLHEDNEEVVCRWTKDDGWKSVDGDTDDEEDEEEDC